MPDETKDAAHEAEQGITREQLRDVYMAGTSDGILRHEDETVRVSPEQSAEQLE